MTPTSSGPTVVQTESAADPSESADSAMGGQKKPFLKTRLGRGLGVTAVVLGGIGVVGFASLKVREKQFTNDWGTVASPHYTPKGEGPYSSYSTLHAEYFGNREHRGLLELAAVEKEQLLSLQEEVIRLREGSIEPAELFQTARALYETNFAPRERGSTPVTADIPELIVPQYDLQNSAPFARELIDAVLQQPLPDSLEFKVGENIFGSAGYANPLTGNVSVAPNGSPETYSDREQFLEEVGTFTHEVGHFVYPLQEGLFFDLKLRANSHEVSSREEAAAHIFRLLAATHVEHPDDRHILAGSVTPRAVDYYNGQEDYGFIKGAAIADAAIVVSGGDLIEAFNLIASDTPLDPAISAVMEETARALVEHDSLSKRNNELRNELRASLRAILSESEAGKDYLEEIGHD